MSVTAYQLASRYLGVAERPGAADMAFIVAWLQQCDPSVQHDEVAWCSAFVHHVAWLLDLPRSKSLSARSWLTIGEPKTLAEAHVGFDVVILKRGSGPQPGPSELHAPGHVAWFGGLTDDGGIVCLGGNQSNAVSKAVFRPERLLGVRRLV